MFYVFQGSDIELIVLQHRNTPLHLAAELRNHAAVEYLLRNKNVVKNVHAYNQVSFLCLTPLTF